MLPKKKHPYNKYIIAICIAFFTYFGLSFMKGFNRVHQYSNPFPKITGAYANIFPQMDTAILKPSYTFFNKFKSPMSTFSLYGDKYAILAYKLSDNKAHKRITDLVEFNWDASPEFTTDSVYNSSYRNGSYTFYDAQAKSSSENTIKINLKSAAKNIRNLGDSILHLKLACNELSGVYEGDSFAAFYLEKMTRLILTDLEMELAFLSKADGAYMLILTPKDPIKDDKIRLLKLLKAE